jgi:glycosyltransferase involved in cell wall biosynthesis
MPRVSIVLAAHDQAAWIGTTIESVRAQTLEDWELVVVDDGSTDETAAVARCHTTDPRIRLLNGERRERAAARNRGISNTSGDLIAFLDGDDLWHPEKLARQVVALDRAPEAGLCYTVARYVDESGRPLPVCRPPRPTGGWIFPALMRANLMILASVMLRRRAIDQVGGFDEKLRPLGCEDWDLWLRIARHFPVAVLPEELTYYRRHGGNTAWPQVLASGLAVVDKHYADPTTAEAASLPHGAARARVLWYHAGAVARTSRRDGLALAARALASAPTTLLDRPALGALASLALPPALRRALDRLPG